MLLHQLCVLIGAMLIPDELWWAYSTYICLSCLYLILHRKWNNVIISIFITIYFVSIRLSESVFAQKNSIFAVINGWLGHPNQMLIRALDEQLYHLESWRLTRALILGEKSGLSMADAWLVQTLGLSHLFVVSGLHVGFVYLLLRLIVEGLWKAAPAGLIRHYPQKSDWLFWCLIPILLLYGTLVGWGPAVTRASLMLFIWQYLKRQHLLLTPNRVLMFAFILVGMLNPFALYGAGIWLSFILVFILFQGAANGLFGVTKLFWLQMLLSLISLTLVSGWQTHVSLATPFVNLIMIPFTAFFWFPLGFVGVIEALWLDANWVMSYLDIAIDTMMMGLNWVLIHLSTFHFSSGFNLLSKVVLVSLVSMSLLLFHKKLVLLSLSLLILVMWIVSGLDYASLDSCYPTHCQKKAWRIVTSQRILSLEYRDSNSPKLQKVLLSGYWYSGEHEIMDFIVHVESNDVLRQLLIWPKSPEALPIDVLFNNPIDWVIFKQQPRPATVQTMLAIQQPWMLVKNGQYLDIYEGRDGYDVRHSNCYFSILRYTDMNCERVEILKSMLN